MRISLVEVSECTALVYFKFLQRNLLLPRFLLDSLLSSAEKKDTSFLKTADANIYMTVRKLEQFLP